jgi:hypothetical protein
VVEPPALAYDGGKSPIFIQERVIMAVLSPLTRRLLAVVLLLMLGLGTLPVSPVAAQNCANLGPGAFLAGCDLSGMDLSGVNLAGSNLRGANLEGANLDGANLSGANLSNARITEGALDSANTAGANLRGIRWVAAPVDPFLTVVWTLNPNGGNFTGVVTGAGLMPGADLNAHETRPDGSVGVFLDSTVPGSGEVSRFYGTTTCGFLTAIVFQTTDRTGAPIETDEPIPC